MKNINITKHKTNIAARSPVRYWGRKAGETLHVVERLLNSISFSRGIALDPFAGAGSLARTLLMRGVKVVASDLNFYAWLISKSSLGRPRRPKRLQDYLASLRLNVVLKNNVKTRRLWWKILNVPCPRGNSPLRYRVCDRRAGKCVAVSVSGCRVETPLECDIKEVLDPYPRTPLYYPSGQSFDKRRTVNSVDELYSPCMLSAMASLARMAKRRWSLYGPVGSTVWLAIAALAYSSSRMQRASGGSWPVNSYWLPDRWLERNPILLIKNKIKLIEESSLGARVCSTIPQLKEIKYGEKDACVLWMSAQKLSSRAPREFFDLLITDPPHYDEIQYYELSVLHLSWLALGLKNGDAEKALNSYEEELVVNPKRGISEKKYLNMLKETFESLLTLLKPGAKIVLILHEEEQYRLKRMIDYIEAAGFRFKHVRESKTPIKPIGRISLSERRNVLTIIAGRKA